jgi:hypothetical protein
MIWRAYTHRIAVAAALAGLAGGCGDGDGTPGDPVDAGGGQDGGDGGSDDGGTDSGVSIEFHFLGPGGERVPAGDAGIAFDSFAIDRLTIQMHRVELIGDAAKPGGLMRRSWSLNYPFDQQPRIHYESAPPGIYSRLKYRVELTYWDEEPPAGFDDERLSARVRGHAFVTQGDLAFEYWDDKKVDVELEFNQLIEEDAGVIAVELDLARWFQPVDWQALADEGDGGDDDNSGPGGDDGGDDDGEDDDGEDDDNSGPGGGGGPHQSDADIPIGEEGHREAADMLRDALRSSFRVAE